MTAGAQKLQPLRLNLSGRQVIEASAGTGKTWTLAALYVRLVLGHQRSPASPLLPPQILVMTFTEAATAELRERIRRRLRDAALWFDHSARSLPMPEGFELDSFLEDLRHDYDPSQWPQCALQLHLAADWMDDAAIYTIHAWSRRMLTQHALDSRILFEQTHLEDAAHLQLELVQDYWRTWLYPLPSDMLQTLLPLLGNSPENTLDQLQTYWREADRKPRAARQPEHTPQAIGQQLLQWQTRCDALATQVRSAWSSDVLEALQTHRIKGARADYYDKWVAHLAQWINDLATPPKLETLRRFTHTELLAKAWPPLTAHAYFFQQLESFTRAAESPPDSKSELIEHAALTVAQAYAQAKEQRGAFDFSDLLQNLYRAVMAEDGRLAQAIREQYPVALVDEFQDTDPWQYGSLHRIYDLQSCNASHAFIMIGDPKQAIYSFRGADLNTYLQARNDAWQRDPDSLHTLTTNHRSSQGLVRAINHVFSGIASPFGQARGDNSIDFVQVDSPGKVQPFMLGNGQAAPSMTVWHMPALGVEKTVNAQQHLHTLSQVFADQMAELLNASSAHPGDMAVLVRGQKQADAMQAALRARKIPSVYLSDRSSVYASLEALDLWRLLKACASPNQLPDVRAAMTSSLWCLELEELQALIHDEALWEQWVEQFHRWHVLWLQRGVLPLLHAFMHTPVLGASVAQRLLSGADGERRLSNLLHLGELLQHAAQGLQGSQGLLRFLENQIQQPTQDSDAQKVRLETDAQCVQIITYHKSKGLQYPLVFVPFAGSFRYETSSKSIAFEDEAQDDSNTTASVDEDMRLLYVALTRAQRALWLGVAETKFDLNKDLKLSALSKLLKRQARGDLHTQLMSTWGTCSDIAVATLPALQGVVYESTSEQITPQAARFTQRNHLSHWWTASFSTLTRGLISESSQEDRLDDALTDARAVEATQDNLATANPWQSFPAGARYGTLLHDLLEWQSLHGWPAAQEATPEWLQQEWLDLLARKAQWMQLQAAQVQQVDAWVKVITRTPLPLAAHSKALTLGWLAREQLWPEMEFNFEAHQLSAQRIDQWIQAHVLPNTPRPGLQARVLNGMLTGFMDLVVRHEGRYWVVDYKSNKLPDYTPAQLQAAVLEKRYEVQYVLYTLALHRLLKIRLPNYNYEQHIGGAIYMFLRGIETPGAGIHAMRPPQVLIETLDAAFEGMHA